MTLRLIWEGCKDRPEGRPALTEVPSAVPAGRDRRHALVRVLELTLGRVRGQIVREEDGVHGKVAHLLVPDGAGEGEDGGTLARLEGVRLAEQLALPTEVAVVIRGRSDGEHQKALRWRRERAQTALNPALSATQASAHLPIKVAAVRAHVERGHRLVVVADELLAHVGLEPRSQGGDIGAPGSVTARAGHRRGHASDAAVRRLRAALGRVVLAFWDGGGADGSAGVLGVLNGTL